MRRIVLITAIMMLITVVASACGAKNADSVVKELDKVQNKLESYQAKGTMTLNTSQQPLEYKVEVWYQKDHYYRIALTNAKKDITQIVLRNDDGVFVLTPRLNKVFRFQSDWPDNQGQVYLYQTLLSSILLDTSRQFATENDSYVFDVMANYQNGSLARQKIWLNKEDFAPRQVEVSDTNAAVMVKVTFDEFNFDPKFEKNAFDTQANLSAGGTASTGDQAGTTDNTNANGTDQQGTTSSTEPSTDNTATSGTDKNGDTSTTTGDQGVTDEKADDQPADETTAQPLEFLELDPVYLPAGVAFKDSQEIEFGGNPGIMQRFQGTYNFSIIQTQPKDVAASYNPGYMLDLGFTMGSISDGEEQQTLTWTYEGIEYRMTSADLPESEMVLIAQSMDEGATK